MLKEEKIILGITGISHLLVHSSMLVLPSILLVLQSEFNVGLATLGFIVTVSYFMFGLGSIPAGLLEKKLGGRTLLIIYQIGLIVSMAVIMISRQLISLTFGLVILGLFSSIYHPAGLTIISRRVKNISSGMAFHGIMGSSGLALGPLIAGIFATFISWRAAYGFLGICMIILLLGTWTLIPHRKKEYLDDVAETKITNKSALVLYYSIAVLVGFSFAGFTTFLPTHFAIETRNVLNFLPDTFRGGLFTTITLLAGIIGQILGGFLGVRYRRANLLFWVVLFNIPFLYLIGFTTGIPLIIIGILFGIVHFTWQPIGNSLIAQITHSHHRGLGYGINFFLGFGVGSFAAGIGGVIAELTEVANVFRVMAVILIPALIFTRMLAKKLSD
ncbi:MFS transporter [Candidatus Neomarinimicrobiota bacterium]